MEDLFGHNRKPHMPRTAAIEAHVYQSPDEANSYRGIKDMDFGIESATVEINSRGLFKSRNSPMGTMRDFVPNPEGYFMEQLHHTMNDTNGINIAEVQRITALNDGQYKTLMAKLPENASGVTIETLKAYGEMLNSIRTLVDTVLPETIEVYRKVCVEGYDWDQQQNDFLAAELKMVSVLDEIDVKRSEMDGAFYGSMEPSDSRIVKEQFDAFAPILISDILPHALGLRKDISAIMGQLNILVGECLRVNDAWHCTSKLTRPSYTPLKRFATTIEKIPGALDIMVSSQRHVFKYLTCLTNRLS